MKNYIIFLISSGVFMSTFFWAMDAVVHQKKTRIAACIIAIIAFMAFGTCLGVLAG